MKIDFSSGMTNQVMAERAAKAVSSSEASATTSATLDRTTLSTSAPSVSNLVSEAMKTPAVRQDKVNALRDAVASGTYPIDSVKIAGAMQDSSD